MLQTGMAFETPLNSLGREGGGERGKDVGGSGEAPSLLDRLTLGS